jgi:mycothiol synthase
MDIKLVDYQDKYKNELINTIFDAYQKHPEYGEPDFKSASKYIEWLKKHSTFFKVLIVNGEVAGFIVADANWKDLSDSKEVGEIHEISIKRKYWGKGFGHYLINEALNHFKEKGKRIVRLWVGKKNKEAVKFYKNLGFRPLYEKWDYIRMEKRL